jgi:hypothetical protein
MINEKIDKHLKIDKLRYLYPSLWHRIFALIGWSIVAIICINLISTFLIAHLSSLLPNIIPQEVFQSIQILLCVFLLFFLAILAYKGSLPFAKKAKRKWIANRKKDLSELI